MRGFKKAREAVGMTQQSFADILGVDQSTVCLWETGKTLPRAKMLARIASICNCTTDELLASDEGGEHSEQSTDP